MGRREKGELLRYEGCSHIYSAASDASIMRQSRALGEHNTCGKTFLLCKSIPLECRSGKSSRPVRVKERSLSRIIENKEAYNYWETWEWVVISNVKYANNFLVILSRRLFEIATKNSYVLKDKYKLSRERSNRNLYRKLVLFANIKSSKFHIYLAWLLHIKNLIKECKIKNVILKTSLLTSTLSNSNFYFFFLFLKICKKLRFRTISFPTIPY